MWKDNAQNLLVKNRTLAGEYSEYYYGDEEEVCEDSMVTCIWGISDSLCHDGRFNATDSGTATLCGGSAELWFSVGCPKACGYCLEGTNKCKNLFPWIGVVFFTEVSKKKHISSSLPSQENFSEHRDALFEVFE